MSKPAARKTSPKGREEETSRESGLRREPVLMHRTARLQRARFYSCVPCAQTWERVQPCSTESSVALTQSLFTDCRLEIWVQERPWWSTQVQGKCWGSAYGANGSQVMRSADIVQARTSGWSLCLFWLSNCPNQPAPHPLQFCVYVFVFLK